MSKPMDPWCVQFRAEGQERTETKISKKTADQSLTIGWTKVKVLISSLKAKQNGGKFRTMELIGEFGGKYRTKSTTLS